MHRWGKVDTRDESQWSLQYHCLTSMNCPTSITRFSVMAHLTLFAANNAQFTTPTTQDCLVLSVV